MRGKELREQGDIGFLGDVCGDAAIDLHGWCLSPSVVAMCSGCGGVANIMKEDSVKVSKVLYDDGWSKKLVGQSQWSRLLSVAMYSICGSVANGREEDDMIMVIMVGATGSIGGSVAWMWMIKLCQSEDIE